LPSKSVMIFIAESKLEEKNELGKAPVLVDPQIIVFPLSGSIAAPFCVKSFWRSPIILGKSFSAMQS
jgi:hypothetical protein